MKKNNNKHLIIVSRHLNNSHGWIQSLSELLVEHLSQQYCVSIIRVDTVRQMVTSFFKLVKSNDTSYTLYTDLTAAVIHLPLIMIKKYSYNIITHWLDVSRPHWLYQKMIPFCLKRAKHIVSVSNYTASLVRSRCTNKDIVVIPHGIGGNILSDQMVSSKSIKKHLLMIGRRVPRKWFDRFIENVMSTLDPEIYHLICISSSPQAKSYQKQISWSAISRSVSILTDISHKDKQQIISQSDLLVMPNRIIPHDPEWFGMVTLEAWVRWIPVLASWIQWIPDAIREQETGKLVPITWQSDHDAQLWVNAIQQFPRSQFDPKRIRKAITENYSLDRMMQCYDELFDQNR